MESHSEKTLGNFVVHGTIGSGGMGELMLGRQPSLDRPVVLKKLRRELATNAEFVERFRREACIAATIHHQNVVTVYDCFSFRGSQYIALEYVEGVDLETALESIGPLPARLTALIALEIARGVEAIHARGMVHRDLKPANILLGRNGEVKIADFGIAIDAGATPLTLPGFVVGSPPYMSPEQLSGDRVDARSDLFSMGSVVYEMLAGEVPYQPPTDEESETLLEQMKREQYEPLRKGAPSSPRYLRKLVQSCLRFKAKRRIGSARKLRATLEQRLGRPTTDDARNEIASWLWEMGLFEVHAGETVIARAPRVEAATWRARLRWLAVGASTAAMVAVLSVVIFQQRAIIRELQGALPKDLPRFSELMVSIENAGLQLRDDALALAAQEITRPPASADSLTANGEPNIDALNDGKDSSR